MKENTEVLIFQQRRHCPTNTYVFFQVMSAESGHQALMRLWMQFRSPCQRQSPPPASGNVSHPGLANR